MAARADLSHLFCSLPWSYAEVHEDGRVFMCCPRYSGLRAIGNVFKSTPGAIWNSRMAQRIRRGVLDASFSHCSHRECPELVGRSLERRADAERHPEIGPFIRDRTTALAKGPATVKLCHDESCNLSCPSCRKETIVANRARQDARAWADCRLEGRADQVEISIDAADPLTYARGGDFARLLQNLAFLAGQRRAGKIRYLMLSFVVQGANFREMPAFVALGRRLGVDRVRFSLIRPWRRGLASRSFAKAMIWNEAHPEFDAFLETLRDPALADPIVWATDVVPFIERARDAPLDLAALKPTPIERLRNWLGG